MHFVWWQFFISDIVMLGSDIADIVDTTQQSAEDTIWFDLKDQQFKLFIEHV